MNSVTSAPAVRQRIPPTPAKPVVFATSTPAKPVVFAPPTPAKPVVFAPPTPAKPVVFATSTPANDINEPIPQPEFHFEVNKFGKCYGQIFSEVFCYTDDEKLVLPDQ
jgi:hypothetical protein